MPFIPAVCWASLGTIAISQTVVLSRSNLIIQTPGTWKLMPHSPALSHLACLALEREVAKHCCLASTPAGDGRGPSDGGALLQISIDFQKHPESWVFFFHDFWEVIPVKPNLMAVCNWKSSHISQTVKPGRVSNLQVLVPGLDSQLSNLMTSVRYTLLFLLPWKRWCVLCHICIAMTFRVFKIQQPLLGNKLRPQGKVTVQFPDGLREAKARQVGTWHSSLSAVCGDESRCNCYDQWRMLKHYAGSCVAPGWV